MILVNKATESICLERPCGLNRLLSRDISAASADNFLSPRLSSRESFQDFFSRSRYPRAAARDSSVDDAPSSPSPSAKEVMPALIARVTALTCSLVIATGTDGLAI